MLHEKGLLCLSDNIEALQFLISRTLCDELAMKGDDCPSWRVSLVVKFNIWLNKARRVPILKLFADFHTKQETTRKHQNHDRERRRTEQLLICFYAG